MAKKSAASKGYRKTAKKKPFLTKKEIIALVAIVAAIVLAIVLFNLFYDDGFIIDRQVEQDDVLAPASNKVRTRYCKVAEANELEGFTRDDQGNTANKIVTYIYRPESEDEHIQYISVNGIAQSAKKLADDAESRYKSTDGLNVLEQIETEVQGHPAYVQGFSLSRYEASPDIEEPADGEAAEPAETAEPAEDTESTEGTESSEPAPNVFEEALSCYVQYDDDHCLRMYIYRTGEDDSFYLSQDELLDYMLKYTESFTMVQPEKK